MFGKRGELRRGERSRVNLASTTTAPTTSYYLPTLFPADEQPS